MTIQAIRGTRDILPDETPRWRFLEQTAREVFALHGFGEVRTPLLEKTELFTRAVGETTDIVEKEMYTFADRNGDSLTLRPEGTASVVRALVEHGLDRVPPWKVYYLGPMFRHERPQKGRYRQFHQIGCEWFGAEGPAADAEMLAMAMRFFRRAGLGDKVTLEINSLGCGVCRPPYRGLLTDSLHARLESLCPTCRLRLERNPLRVLDCKEEGCRRVARESPIMADHLCGACGPHFDGVKGHLEAMGIPYQLNGLMVRGLDYYTRTGFEITTTALGSQNAVAAGGRYDALVAEMGGRPTPSIGFAMGVERLALLLDEGLVKAPVPTLFVAAAEGEAGRAAVWAERWREAGIAVETHLEGSLKTQMKKAGRVGSPWCVIVGVEESQRGKVILREMAGGGQEELSGE
ncbi:MAG: histidine--tRNA ligase, partial [Magnetococcales bacterium]|nr:histidine--tRNA ligase [Magnetococcales bacterium]